MPPARSSTPACPRSSGRRERRSSCSVGVGATVRCCRQARYTSFVNATDGQLSASQPVVRDERVHRSSRTTRRRPAARRSRCTSPRPNSSSSTGAPAPMSTSRDCHVERAADEDRDLHVSGEGGLEEGWIDRYLVHQDPRHRLGWPAPADDADLPDALTDDREYRTTPDHTVPHQTRTIVALSPDGASR